jgi:hypothetical protein
MRATNKTWVGIAIAVMCAALTLATTGASAIGDKQGDDHDVARPFTFAVIGDIPYGAAQIAAFPGRIDELNADPDVELVDHLGDIKSGSSVCSDEYFAMIKGQFDRFADPLVYTSGDNEWTDCHRANNGAYNPLERLAKVRDVFFAVPGQTLGQHPVTVHSQARQGYVENVSYSRADVAFAAVHVVGSNDSLTPWTGQSAPTPEQTAEVLGRTAADIGLIHDTFRRADAGHSRAVVLMLQADMFDATVPAPAYAEWYGFQPIVQAIAQEAAVFDGPVVLFNGDSHVYRDDYPLAAGSPWLAFYGVSSVAPNLHRFTIEGSTGVDEWLKVTIDQHNPAVVAVTRVPFS